MEDSDILEAVRHVAGRDGLLLSPEGAATYVAYRTAAARGLISASDEVILFNCATGLKYPMPSDARIDIRGPGTSQTLYAKHRVRTVAPGKITTKTAPKVTPKIPPKAGISARGRGFNLTGVSLDSAGAGKNLSGRVAAVLLEKIREGGLAPGERLPTEHVMAQRFGVSRTVIREAMVTLKAEGLVETRQGSGAFVRRPGIKSAFNIDPLAREAVQQILSMMEMRHAIDADVAALAAERRSPQQIDDIRRALAAIDTAVAAGGNGVHEDVQFHLSIARATGNPYWVKLVEMFAPQLHAAITVTRANEALRKDFQEASKVEHQNILAAIIASDVNAARAAAAGHMEGASERVSAADQEFWAREGKEHARLLAGTSSKN